MRDRSALVSCREFPATRPPERKKSASPLRPLKERPRRVNNRSLLVRLPTVYAKVSIAPFRPASFDAHRMFFLESSVIDHGHRIAPRAILVDIDTPRQVNEILRHPGDIADCGFARQKDP